jgi:hypothetical protein
MRRLLAALVACLLLCPGAAAAQSLWVKPYEPNQVSVAFMRPVFTDPASEVAPASGTAFAGTSVSLTSYIELIGEMPLVWYGAGDPSPRLRLEPGNPYLGVGIASEETPVFWELGARVPLAEGPPDALAFGRTADVSRGTAFSPQTVTIQAAGNYRLPFSRRAGLRLRGGLNLALRAEGSRVGTSEVIVPLSVQFWQEGEVFVFGVGATSQVYTARTSSFQDAVDAYATGTAMIHYERFQPGIVIGAPLTRPATTVADMLLGVTLSYTFRSTPGVY